MLESLPLKDVDGELCWTADHNKGEDIFALLAKVHITWETKDLVLDLIAKALERLAEDTGSGAGGGGGGARKTSALETFQSCLKVSQNVKNCEYFERIRKKAKTRIQEVP